MKFSIQTHDQLIDMAVSAARLAGSLVMNFYGREDSLTQLKGDGSPLTRADMASHHGILEYLAPLQIPIVSEEADFNVSEEVDLYWLIDPLDGTKDFLANNDEFTINIALVKNHQPIVGVLFAPALNELYVGSIFLPATREVSGLSKSPPVLTKSENKKMAISRFHNSHAAHDFASRNKIENFVAIGASLKYARIAFGEIDVYPRLVGTSEWDTAAGQAILESVGGNMYDLETMKPIVYGKTARRNRGFLATRKPYTIEDFIL